MHALTRRRDREAHAESWHVYYGDVRVGTIGMRAGVPVDADQWALRLLSGHGQSPTSKRHGQHVQGSARDISKGVAAAFADVNRSQFSGLARSARFHDLEI
jgi:hypothetical protein